MKAVWGALVFLWVVISNNACTSYKSSKDSSAALSSTKFSGQELYNINCASCHQPIEISTRRNKTADQITTAIKFVLQMKDLPDLVALTPEQIKLIAEALSAPVTQPDPGGGTGTVKPALTYQQPLGNRLFVASKLKSLFSGGNATINTTIEASTTNQAPFFAGPCNRTVPECRGNEEQNILVSGMAHANVMRNGYRVKACEAVLENDIAVTNLLSQLSLALTSPRTKDNVGKVYDIMLAMDINDAVFADYAAISTSVASDLESWRMIMLSMCKSTLFENF
jgi:hypothetical protein